MSNTVKRQLQCELQPRTLRTRIEEAIRAAIGDTRQASTNVCTILEDEFGFAEDGHFDDDPELINMLLDRE